MAIIFIFLPAKLGFILHKLPLRYRSCLGSIPPALGISLLLLYLFLYLISIGRKLIYSALKLLLCIKPTKISLLLTPLTVIKKFLLKSSLGFLRFCHCLLCIRFSFCFRDCFIRFRLSLFY